MRRKGEVGADSCQSQAANCQLLFNFEAGTDIY